MHNNLIILAGGASSRMKNSEANSKLTIEELEQSNHRSKGLISIDKNQRPIIDYLMYNAQQAGYSNIFIVVNEHDQMFKELYGNNFHGLNIFYALQYVPEKRIKPLGTADAVFQSMEQFPKLKSDYFTVCNSDNLYSIQALKALTETSAENALIGYNIKALKFTKERIARFAVLNLNSENRLLGIVEKPKHESISDYMDNEGSIRISMNIFKFSGSLMFKYFKNCPLHPERNEKEIPTVLTNFIAQEKGNIEVIPFSEHVPDLTSKEDILYMKQFINTHYGQLNWPM